MLIDKEKLRYDLAMQSALAATVSQLIKGQTLNPAGVIPNYFALFYNQYGEGQPLHAKFLDALTLLEESE